jgi:hypothetical protein
MYKTIRGDVSDHIPIGIERIPSSIVIRLIDDYTDIYELFKNLNIIPYLNDNWKKKFIEQESRLRTNYQLVYFIPIDSNYIEDFMYACKFKPNALKLIYDSLEFDIELLDKNLYYYLYERTNKDKNDIFFRQPKPYLK